MSPEAVKSHGAGVKLVYTPIHGSGYMPVTTILNRMYRKRTHRHRSYVFKQVRVYAVCREYLRNLYCKFARILARIVGYYDVGVNRMNMFTVRRATKGLADYINTLGKEACGRGVVISYDTALCRNKGFCL